MTPLLNALAQCYRGEENLISTEVKESETRLNYRIPKSPLPMPVYTSGRVLRGDIRVPGVLRCLERLACLYGVEVSDYRNFSFEMWFLFTMRFFMISFCFFKKIIFVVAFAVYFWNRPALSYHLFNGFSSK